MSRVGKALVALCVVSLSTRAADDPLPRDPDVLSIAGVEIRRGERRELALPISESFLAREVAAPLVVVRGSRPGPVLCLTGGIHGDELNGVAIVDEAVERLSPESGTLIALPIANVFGFLAKSRYLPDRRDLNRYFPGGKEGSIATRIAGRIWSEVITHCTHLLDFHTGSLERSNLPQTRGDLRRDDVRSLARAFGAPVVIHNPGLHGTLRAEATTSGIAALLYEAGETGRFQRSAIDAGLGGIENVLSGLGMRKKSEGTAPLQRAYLETHWIRAPIGGLVELTVKLGDELRPGDVVGRVRDPLRHARGEVTTSRPGRVIGLSLEPLANPGTALVHLGIEDGNFEAGEAAEPEPERPE